VISDEKAVLERYSSPSLRRNVLSPWAKRHQLESLRVPEAEIKKILEELYP
jgi:hypothetical protein